ncbi:LLM class flavin-dependent oxidoreductase, partial [Pseudomonas sp. SIMBA_064]
VLSTHTEGLTSYMMRPVGSGKPLTAGDVRQRFANVTRGTDLILVGRPEQIADRVEEHARIAGTSGYMLNPLTSPGTLEELAGLGVPARQKRGL